MRHMSETNPLLPKAGARTAPRAALAAIVILSAGCAMAATHSISSGSNLATLLNGSSLADGDVIEITADFSMSASYTISKRVTMRSSGNTVKTIRRGTAYNTRRYYFAITGQVTVENLVFDGSSSSSGGYCMFYLNAANASLTLGSGVTVRNVFGSGEALSAIRIRSGGGTLVLEEGSLISNCRNSGGPGGAINNAGTVVMAGGRITGCSTTSASYAGGAINNTGTLTISGGEIDACESARYGGGVCNAGGTFAMTGGRISGCSAERGGAIENSAAMRRSRAAS